MRVREIAQRCRADLYDMDDDCEAKAQRIEAAIREAAKPLVEALEHIRCRGDVGAWEVEGALEDCTNTADNALAVWKEEG